MRIVVFFLAVLTLTFCFLTYPAEHVSAAFWSDSWLIRINDKEYSGVEYRNWWAHWNDKKSKTAPETPDEFIEHQLLIQQAVEMEYEQQPDYINKTEVYRKFRSIMALRNEEINEKINITDEDVNNYFYQNYSPVWFLQVLTFKDMATAEDAYTKLESLSGQPEGRLFVADLQGVKPEDGGPLAYEEAKVTPFQIRKAKKEYWLKVLEKLDKFDIAKPFAIEGEEGHAVILRLENKTRPEETEVEKKRKLILNRIFKARTRQETNRLLKTLMTKYHVVIDEDLVAEVDLEKDYDKEFLDQIIISMDGLEVTVNDLIHNMKRERILRKKGGASPDFIKNYMMSNIVSQTLIDKEALSRHYENRPPLKKTWDFYKNNMLRVALLSGIKKKAVATEEEILEYYNENKDRFSLSSQVEYEFIKGEPEVIDAIWKDLLNDSTSDFTIVAEKYGKFPRSQRVDIESLDPEMARVVKKLAIGDTSKPFKYDGAAAVVILREKRAGKAMPLEMVKGQIANELKDIKYQKEKASYLEKIRSRSVVEVNEKKWNKLKKEL